ncbi:Helicase [Chitinophaga costaii]|uniref:Helicase n=1 Tax=Chitinophaga costaii TaxID=1335309 RepID=A0A1C4FG58_9BACT|nr:AAA family ATPase [Chitinophaga costaii]PUZ20145.1 helicase [Chitinophaga costaii]SCC55007.1 Helicase [Chitinophaga costaii]
MTPTHTLDLSNETFTLAANFVMNTTRHLFLTGKAGTGKTTFLRHIREQVKKNTVIVAPTGVAAINAGGVTVHSFFQLPFAPFLPETNGLFQQGPAGSSHHPLLKGLRIGAEKKALMLEMELLIIDEVSMLRADMLDAIDLILRHIRKQPVQPFGGVQVIYIGDLFQLPPVVPQDQWELLAPHYPSPFFFHAWVVKQSPPLYVALQKIYRQNDRQFIDLLNRVRNNEVQPADLELLNARFLADFDQEQHKGYITLTTHNSKAEAINLDALEALPTGLHTFEGRITGDFSDKALPTEMILSLKTGAQVMFLKNDTEKVRRFYNGKIGTIKSIDQKRILVTFEGEDTELEVEEETWHNIRYHFNVQTRRIEEEEIGTFTQFPIRLAWAITIHKSQGLTFQKAVIDAGDAFAAGQVYVALSRCVSMEGMVLRSRIGAHCIHTDAEVMAFARRESGVQELHHQLSNEKHRTLVHHYLSIFQWQFITDQLQHQKEKTQMKSFPERQPAIAFFSELIAKAEKQQAVSESFQRQLLQLLQDTIATGNTTQLETRLQAGLQYFTKILQEELLQPLEAHIETMKTKTGVGRYLVQLEPLEDLLREKLKRLQSPGAVTVA